MLRLIGVLLLACSPVFIASVIAQSSLASRVLVVYDVTDPISSEVATHYQSSRGVPSANMCQLSLNATSAIEYTPAQYATTIKAPVQACLNAVGPANILYIVLAYLRPYRVNDQGPIYLALDSVLADIWDQYTTRYFTIPGVTHRYYYETQSQGNVYAPFQSLAAYRALGRYAMIYSVWRLDGLTKDIAKGLVDKALAAELNGGPISLVQNAKPDACIDMRLDPTFPTAPDSGYYSGNWDLWRGSQFLIGSGAFNVVSDFNDAPFGTPPAPLTCGNANTGWYTGWYNYNTYNDAFTWDTGSIGWDLDSAGLIDPRGGTSWSTIALQKGIAVTSGSMSEPYLEGIPRPAGVIHDLMEGANAGDAFLRNTRWIKWRMINVGDPLYQPYPNKLPPFNTTDGANSLAFSARGVVPSTSVLGTITLSAPAPANGATVNLSVDQAGVTVPPSVTIPSGAASANFVATTSTVTAATSVQVIASGPVSVRNTITVYPLLSGLGFAQNSVKGGTLLTAAVFLNASAPLSGITVTLSSDQPGVASVPASVVVLQGLSQALFQIQTSTVGSNTNVNITSSYAGATQPATLTVTP
jgi:uncharacterized protein (TIGR03790 family)